MKATHAKPTHCKTAKDPAWASHLSIEKPRLGRVTTWRRVYYESAHSTHLSISVMADTVWATFQTLQQHSVKQCQEPTWRHLSFHDNTLGWRTRRRRRIKRERARALQSNAGNSLTKQRCLRLFRNAMMKKVHDKNNLTAQLWMPSMQQLKCREWNSANATWLGIRSREDFCLLQTWLHPSEYKWPIVADALPASPGLCECGVHVLSSVSLRFSQLLALASCGTAAGHTA